MIEQQSLEVVHTHTHTHTHGDFPKNIKCRNHYIDVLKGIAIITVIFIHTVFHSGNAYVPRWFSNYTVLFEVPMFIFLAGWSYSYSKSNKSYIQGMIITQIKYMAFMVLVYVGIKITNYIQFSHNEISIQNLIQWFFHIYTTTKPFDSVSGSLWFFRMYFYISLLGAMMITLAKSIVRKYILISCVLAIFMITFIYPKIGSINLGIELSYICFYLFFYILGYHMKDKQISIKKCISILFIFTILLVEIQYLTKFDVTQVERNKFPPNFVFLIWSLYGVVIVLYLKKFFIKCKENTLSKIGQNSMYIFLAQGVGSSVLYWISPYIQMEWYYKMWIMFGINCIITAVVTVILKVILDFVGKHSKKILKENLIS